MPIAVATAIEAINALQQRMVGSDRYEGLMWTHGCVSLSYWKIASSGEAASNTKGLNLVPQTKCRQSHCAAGINVVS